MSGYLDKVKCPRCSASRLIYRQGASAGKFVKNFCTNCKKHFTARAGFQKKEEK